MPKPVYKKRTKGPMLVHDTPIEDYLDEYSLLVKREDLSCPPPGPPFSKTRGVYARVKSRPEKVIGVLDTRHSQAGWAVARACQLLGKTCINYYPVYKADGEPERGKHNLREPQARALRLGAKLVPLKAGRSCILFHAARKLTEAKGGYIMPNALKLEESAMETAKEVPTKGSPIHELMKENDVHTVLIPISSGTIAAGVIRGFCDNFNIPPTFIIHLGYSRSHDEVLRYLAAQSGYNIAEHSIELIDENFSYKDEARPGETPPWPCNPWYDLKAFRWWLASRHKLEGARALLWNIG